MSKWRRSKFTRIILMVGKTGVGKSSLGNSMSGSSCFQTDSLFSSTTKEPEKATGSFHDNVYEFIDTPGLYDTDRGEDKTADIIGSCVNLSLPGPHVFLFVISITSKFTDEDYNTYKKLNKNFGDEVFDYMVLIFTSKKRLGRRTENKYIQSATDRLKEVVKKCSWRYVFIECDDSDPKHAEDVTKVYKKIEEVIKHNNDANYTNEMYRNAVSKKKRDYRINKVIEYGVPLAGGAVGGALGALGGPLGSALGGALGARAGLIVASIAVKLARKSIP